MDKKSPKYSEKELKMAANILTALSFCSSMQEVDTLWQQLFDQYGLMLDPFVNLPCTPKDYAEACKEYDRQAMEAKFGYWED